MDAVEGVVDGVLEGGCGEGEALGHEEAHEYYDDEAHLRPGSVASVVIVVVAQGCVLLLEWLATGRARRRPLARRAAYHEHLE